MEPVRAGFADGAEDVVGAIDGEGSRRKYVIADITTDRAWLSVAEGEALALDAWR